MLNRQNGMNGLKYELWKRYLRVTLYNRTCTGMISFFILLLEHGSGSHEIDFTPYPVLNNSVFFLRPGQVHQLQMDASCTGYLMEFNDQFYHPADKTSIQD